MDTVQDEVQTEPRQRLVLGLGPRGRRWAWGLAVGVLLANWVYLLRTLPELG